jgi:Smg protein
MFDVLVYLYENYWRPDACPEPKQLSRKLSAVGFEAEEINDALKWLDGLAHTAEGGTEALTRLQPQAGSLRIYTAHERDVLGDDSIGFISFLESAGVMAPAMREMVIDRALAVGSGRIELDDLKIIVLMVFWSLGEEPDALILDELFVDSEDRVIH